MLPPVVQAIFEAVLLGGCGLLFVGLIVGHILDVRDNRQASREKLRRHAELEPLRIAQVFWQKNREAHERFLITMRDIDAYVEAHR